MFVQEGENAAQFFQEDVFGDLTHRKGQNAAQFFQQEFWRQTGPNAALFVCQSGFLTTYFLQVRPSKEGKMLPNFCQEDFLAIGFLQICHQKSGNAAQFLLKRFLR